MANNEYLAALGADYLKTNQMFSGNTMYVPDSLGYTQNVDTATTAPASNSLANHQFLMETNPEYRQQQALLQMGPPSMPAINGLGYLVP